MAPPGFSDFLNIGKIARSARGEFCCNQVILGDEERLEAGLRVNDAFDPSFPCSIEIDSGNIGKKIDRLWFPAKAEKAGAVSKFVDADVLEGCSKLRQRGISGSGVGEVRFYKHVNVLGRAGLRVKRYGVPADDQVLNAM